MGWEIERRFLVKVNALSWPSLTDGDHLRQGYLTHSKEPSVRVRLGEPGGPKLTSKRGAGVRRTEFECEISTDVAKELMDASGPRTIEKVRWSLGPWTLDRFLGSLEGLSILEIELTSEEETLPTFPPGITVIHEITDDKRMSNGYLASLHQAAQKKIVLAAYSGGLE
tara:strand:+ start:415 stop:918 length:504 start_codon:yes stop_codon:yes gene_type:complete